MKAIAFTLSQSSYRSGSGSLSTSECVKNNLMSLKVGWALPTLQFLSSELLIDEHSISFLAAGNACLGNYCFWRLIEVKLKIIAATILTSLCLAASFGVAYSSVQGATTKAAEDTSWLKESFYKQFPNQRDAVDRELQVLRINLDNDADSEYLAWLSLDRINGLGILFDRQGSAYKAVYQIKDPIYQVSFDQPSRSVIISAGNGGTGVQHNWFHVIQKVGGNYQEVWSGIEKSVMFGVPPFTERLGTISISQDPVSNAPVLRHTTRTTVLDKDYSTREIRDAVDNYVFKPDQGRFVPMGQFAGVSQHLVLDRPEAFAGEGVKILVTGLTPNQRQGTKVNLLDSKGKVVASTSDREPTPTDLTTVWLPFPRDLAPGTYTVQLVQQSGNQPNVLDINSVVIRNPQM